MSIYQIIEGGGIRRVADAAVIPADAANRDYQAYLAWQTAGGVADPYEPPAVEPGTMPPRLVASALSVAVAGEDVAAVEGVFGLAAAAYLDVGLYMLFFLTPQPDTEYFAVINGGAPCMNVFEKSTDYLIIEAKAAVDGIAVDPAQFGVQIFRI